MNIMLYDDPSNPNTKKSAQINQIMLCDEAEISIKKVFDLCLSKIKKMRDQDLSCIGKPVSCSESSQVYF